jgi:4-amino-4-deoxy-L-arabinose transferase-like glycosyltransferase
VADIAIVGFILVGALVGFSKGFLLPLIAAGGALFAIAFLFAGPANGAVPSGSVGLGAGAVALGLGATLFARIGMTITGLIHRFRLLKTVDKMLGIPIGMATAAVALYIALLGTLTLDAWLDPLHGKAAIGTQDIAALQTIAKTNPTLSVFASPTMLQALLESAAAKGPLSGDQLSQADSPLGFYEQKVRPELLTSKIVPVLLAVGEKLPFIGRPATLPTR